MIELWSHLHQFIEGSPYFFMGFMALEVLIAGLTLSLVVTLSLRRWWLTLACLLQGMLFAIISYFLPDLIQGLTLLRSDWSVAVLWNGISTPAVFTQLVLLSVFSCLITFSSQLMLCLSPVFTARFKHVKQMWGQFLEIYPLFWLQGAIGTIFLAFTRWQTLALETTHLVFVFQVVFFFSVLDGLMNLLLGLSQKSLQGIMRLLFSIGSVLILSVLMVDMFRVISLYQSVSLALWRHLWVFLTGVIVLGLYANGWVRLYYSAYWKKNRFSLSQVVLHLLLILSLETVVFLLYSLSLWASYLLIIPVYFASFFCVFWGIDQLQVSVNRGKLVFDNPQNSLQNLVKKYFSTAY